MQKCLDCGHEMTEHRENYKYAPPDLPGVTLVDVKMIRCDYCGESLLATPKLSLLVQTRLLALVRKRTRLTPLEVRYIRAGFAWSGRELAIHMGTTPETVSRWEHGKLPIGVQADRLLRLMVAHEKELPFSLDELKNVATEPAAELRLRLRFDETRDAWEAVPDKRHGGASQNPILAPVPEREPLGTEDTASRP
ncbi:MAG: hypothetical protein F4Z04_06840 [Acidobacteria bacterium]|nr:hypothetical protein [Acidobacteriota bacterium]